MKFRSLLQELIAAQIAHDVERLNQEYFACPCGIQMPRKLHQSIAEKETGSNGGHRAAVPV